jgi:hypothetical protein
MKAAVWTSRKEIFGIQVCPKDGLPVIVGNVDTPLPPAGGESASPHDRQATSPLKPVLCFGNHTYPFNM